MSSIHTNGNHTVSDQAMLRLSNFSTCTTDCLVNIVYHSGKVVGLFIIDANTAEFVDRETIAERVKQNASWAVGNELELAESILTSVSGKATFQALGYVEA
jgi:hypothetical protein